MNLMSVYMPVIRTRILSASLIIIKRRLTWARNRSPLNQNQFSHQVLRSATISRELAVLGRGPNWLMKDVTLFRPAAVLINGGLPPGWTEKHSERQHLGRRVGIAGSM